MRFSIICFSRFKYNRYTSWPDRRLPGPGLSGSLGYVGSRSVIRLVDESNKIVFDRIGRAFPCLYPNTVGRTDKTLRFPNSGYYTL